MIAQKNGITKRPSVINPENPGLAILAEQIYGVLDSEFENAPINSYLQDYFTSLTDEADFLEYREIVWKIFYNSYLITPFGDERFENAIEEYTEELEENDLDPEYLDLFIYDFVNSYIFTTPCGPLALPFYQWLNVLIPGNQDSGKPFEQEKGYFLIKEICSDKIVAETTDNKLVEILKESFKKPETLSEGTVIAGSLIRFKDYLVLNGLMMPINKALFDEKREEDEILQQKLSLVEEKFFENRSSRMIYAKDMEEMNEVLSKILGVPGVDYPQGNPTPKEKNLLGYMHSKKGLIFFGDSALAVSDSNNPCYDKQNAMENSLRLLLGVNGSEGELIKYLIDNRLLQGMRINSLKGEEHGRKLVQDNIEFMFRFFQPEIFLK